MINSKYYRKVHWKNLDDWLIIIHGWNIKLVDLWKKKEKKKEEEEEEEKRVIEVSKSSIWKLKNFISPFCRTPRIFKNIHRYARNIIYIILDSWCESRSGC